MYHLVVDLLRPYTLLCLLMGAALVNLWSRRRETRGRLLCLTVPFVALVLLSLPAMSYLLLGTLEWRYPPVTQRPANVEAIVVLSAGIRPPDAVRTRAELDPDSLYRCLHAAEVYHQGPPCPVLLSGGKVDPEAPGPPTAELMRDFLLKLGVNAADLITETQSRTTYENAAQCRTLLEPRGIHRIVLVTDATHLLRALLCFRKQPIEVIPSGCQYRATHLDYKLTNFLPSSDAALNCQRAIHEWLGAVWYWIHGRI